MTPHPDRYTRETWASEKLTRALERIAATGEGNRHNDVLGAAASVADYVADGALPRDAAEAALLAAAVAVGLAGTRAKEARHCVAFGLDKGRAQKAWYPWSASSEPVTDRFRWNGRKPVEIRAVQKPRHVGQQPLPTCGITSDEIRITTFPSIRKVQGSSSIWTWSALADRVARPVEWPAAGKEGLELWTCAELAGDSRARRPDGLDSHGDEKTRDALVERLHALVLDYDDETAWSLAIVRRWWGAVRYVAHTSAHHDIEKQTSKTPHPAMGRGRVILALSRPTTTSEHMQIADWVIACGRGLVGAPEIRTPARAYFVPAAGPTGLYDHESNLVDTVIDVDALLTQIATAATQGEQAEAEILPDPDILALLDVSEEGRPKNTLRNILLILDDDRRWKGRLRHCDFSGRDLLDGRPLSDASEIEAAVWLAQVYRIDASGQRVHDASTAITARHPTHPVRGYLDSVTWDGKIRLLRWLERAGCDDSADGLTSTYGRKWMISAVARAYDPGCQVDSALILAGPKGYGKTSVLRALAGLEWHAESALQIGDKDAYQQLQGVWIYELGELDSLRRSDVSAVKQYITSRVDKFRPSYGRNIIERPRQCVFAGTTNDQHFLSESDRRWWVRVVRRPADLDWLATWRDQLWAEAVTRYRRGEAWHLDAEEEALQVVDVDAYLHYDPWESVIREHTLGTARVTVRDILIRVIGLRLHELTKAHEIRVARILGEMGWRSRASNGERSWSPPPPSLPPPDSTDSTVPGRSPC